MNSEVSKTSLKMGDLTVSKLYFLSLMTLSYIVGELTHFLINTTSRDVARGVEFGENSCFVNGSFALDEDKEIFECPESKNETHCETKKHCNWEYSGLGIQYQVLEYARDENIFIIWFV